MTVSEQIIQVLDALCAKFGIVIDWTATNVMPQLEVLCGKFIRFEIWTSIAYMVIVTVMLAVSWIVFGATRKGAVEDDYDVTLISIVNVAAGAIGAVMILIFFGVVGQQSFDIIEAVTFPEKTLFDYVNGLMGPR